MHNIESPVFRVIPVRTKVTHIEGWIIGRVRNILGKELVVFEPVKPGLCQVLDPLSVESREPQ